MAENQTTPWCERLLAAVAELVLGPPHVVRVEVVYPGEGRPLRMAYRNVRAHSRQAAATKVLRLESCQADLSGFARVSVEVTPV
jgi:hypothetical protein